MRRAWRETDYQRALEQLTRLADELERTHPGAAGSLREGIQETLTVIKSGSAASSAARWSRRTRASR
jgi:putative transposase